MATKEEDAPDSGFTLSGDSSPGEGTAANGLTKIDFSTFVISLASSALFHMGVADDPQTGEPSPKNLILARQTIDTLEMLAEKTRGNLGQQESKLMESVLFDLRMRFVEAGK